MWPAAQPIGTLALPAQELQSRQICRCCSELLRLKSGLAARRQDVILWRSISDFCSVDGSHTRPGRTQAAGLQHTTEAGAAGCQAGQELRLCLWLCRV